MPNNPSQHPKSSNFQYPAITHHISSLHLSIESISAQNRHSTMSCKFLELPNDVFHMVTKRVKDVGPEALLPLRATSRLFRDEVNDIIFVKSSVAELKAEPYTDFAKHNTDLYLFGKLIDPRGVQPELPALVHKMTDHLCNALNLTAAEDRLCCERRLCEGLVQYYGGRLRRRLLWYQGAAAEVNKLMSCYKELAALLFGVHDISGYLWSGSLERIPTHMKARATPLVYAVAVEDTELVDLVIDSYNNHIRRYVGTASSIMAHLNTALSMALKQSRVDFACKIAQATRTFMDMNCSGSSFSKIDYLEWLDSAIALADPECVRSIVQLCPGGIPLRDGHFTSALKSSNFEVVKTLFELGKIDVNNTLFEGLPIKLACGAGNIPVIQGLIDAGSQVPDSALSCALKHDKLGSFLYLWRSGHPVPAMDKWPRKCSQTMYDTLCMMEIAEGTKQQSLPQYDKFRGMSSQALRDV